jgi:hypothetical protein
LELEERGYSKVHCFVAKTDGTVEYKNELHFMVRGIRKLVQSSC